MVLGLFLPSLAVAVRRLHDTNRSGWFYLISFIRLVGAIILIVFMCQDSARGRIATGLHLKKPEATNRLRARADATPMLMTWTSSSP